MNNIIFFKKLPGRDYNLIHLYEHLVMNGFQKYLLQKELDPNLVGSYNGETFVNLLYVYGEFNSENYTRLFNDYINSGQLDITADDINNELRRMGAENCAIYQATDTSALEEELQLLHKQPFSPLASHDTIEHKWPSQIASPSNPVIEPSDGTDSYDIVSINIELPIDNLELVAVFSNLTYYLNESICHHFKKYGAYYCGDVVEDNQDDNAIVSCLDLYIPKGEYNIDTIRHDLTELIRNTDFTRHAHELNSYFSRPYKPSGVTYDYQSIGLFISQAKLKSLLTVENANRVWRSLKIDQINIFPDDRQCDDIYLRLDRYTR